ncbi:MAG TPA: SBBP repeat-containing protein, partial [Fimbriimonadaceae bacterium]|nr:SBBP repeat-containing protein [Fimbriimonadaceae bacterium]
MMKVIFAFLLMLSMVATSGAVVTREWIRFYDTEEPGHNTLRRLARDPAGNIYMVGESPRFYGVDIVKYSPTGAVLWSRYYSTNSTSDRINAVQVDSLGNLYLVGYMHPGSASPDVLVLKYSPAGTMVWRRIVDLSGSVDSAEAAVIGSNGGITLVAKIGSSTDLMLMSYRPDGVLSWQKRVEVGAPQHSAFFMFTDQNKNIVTVTTPVWSPYIERLWAHKCDSVGDPVWTKVYSPPGQELRCNEAKMDAEGGVVFVGYIEEIYQPNKAVLGRLSPSGEVSWQVTYAASSSFDSWGMALAIDPSGNAFAFCRISKPENSFGTALLKVSRNGSLLWSRELPQERLALDGAETDSDGNVYAIGGQFMGDHWSLATAKYLGDGEQAWIDNYSDDNNGTSGSRELLVQLNGDVYVGG